jgi:hypothetical protein
MKPIQTALWLALLMALQAAHAAPQLAHFSPSSTVVTGEPLITGIYVDETNIVVTAQVPSGFAKVTLEGSDRFAGAPWLPKAVARPNAQSGRLLFRLPPGAGLEILRLKADTSDPLPAFFYSGATDFAGQPACWEPRSRLMQTGRRLRAPWSSPISGRFTGIRFTSSTSIAGCRSST